MLVDNQPVATEVLWAPVNALLFSLPEIFGPISFHISCNVIAPDGVKAVSYSARFKQGGELFNLEVNANGVTVSAESLSGHFRINFIDYQKDLAVARVTAWEDLPSDADEIIEFSPSRKAVSTYSLFVEATLSNGENFEFTYTLEVLQDWTAGRDKLQGEVNGRRNNKG